MRTTYTDEEIIRGIKSSPSEQEKMMKYLYHDTEYRKMGFSKINHYIDSSEEAESIFVDSLMALRKNIVFNKFKGESSLRTYFVRICFNQAIDCLKKKKKQTAQENEYITEIKYLKPDTVYDDSSLLNDLALYETQLKQSVYEKLSEKCRTVLRQKYWEDLKIKEIAIKSSIKESSVKNKLFNCREKLRSLIEDNPKLWNL